MSLFQKSFKSFYLVGKLSFLDGAFNLEEKFSGIKRFCEIITGSSFHGFNCTLNASIGSKDNNRHFRIHEMQLFHERYAICIKQLQVNDRKIKNLIFCFLFCL